MYRDTTKLLVETSAKNLVKSNSGTFVRRKEDIQGLQPSEIELGEDELRNEHDFKILDMNNDVFYDGRFIMTRLKVVFVPYDETLANDKFLKKYHTVELNMIEKVTKYASKKHPDQFYLDIFTKDFRQLRIMPRSHPNMDEIYNNLIMVAFPSKYSSSIIALKYDITPTKMKQYDRQIVEKLLHVIPEFRNYSKLHKDGWNVS